MCAYTLIDVMPAQRRFRMLRKVRQLLKALAIGVNPTQLAEHGYANEV